MGKWFFTNCQSHRLAHMAEQRKDISKTESTEIVGYR